ncbi:MAG: hypothetical protein AABY07_09725 [Nanoarchaeota archaeon]
MAKLKDYVSSVLGAGIVGAIELAKVKGTPVLDYVNASTFASAGLASFGGSMLARKNTDGIGYILAGLGVQAAETFGRFLFESGYDNLFDRRAIAAAAVTVATGLVSGVVNYFRSIEYRNARLERSAAKHEIGKRELDAANTRLDEIVNANTALTQTFKNAGVPDGDLGKKKFVETEKEGIQDLYGGLQDILFRRFKRACRLPR